MTTISSLFAAIKEDVNREESVIMEGYSTMLRYLFKLVILFGIPFILFVLYEFIQGI